MLFLNPTLLLAGLASVALPILIHLLMRRRRRPTPWAAMRFVQEAVKRLRRRLLIQRWLLLAARCLLLAAVAIAIGRPLIGAGPAAGQRQTVILIVDDSLTESASAGGSTGPSAGAGTSSALARSISAAAALLGSLREGDRVAVITSAAPAEALITPPSSDLASVKRVLDGVKAKDSRSDLPSALALAGLTIAESRLAKLSTQGERITILSSLRSGTIDPTAGAPKLPGDVQLSALPPLPGADNTAVADLSLARGMLLDNDTTSARTVQITLSRSGPDVAARSQPITLAVGADGGATPGTPDLATTTVTAAAAWPAGVRTLTVSATLPPVGSRPSASTTALPSGQASGAQSQPRGSGLLITASLAEDGLPRDNVVSLGARSTGTIQVAIIADEDSLLRAGNGEVSPARWFGLALAPTPSVPVRTTVLPPAGLSTTQLAEMDAAVVLAPHRLATSAAEALAGLIKRGGLVLLVPPSELAPSQWPTSLLPILGVTAKLAQEPTALGEVQRLDATFAPSPSAQALLGPLVRELPDLVPAVGISAVLKVLPGSGDSPLLVTGAGLPVLTLLAEAAAEPKAAGPGGSDTTATSGGSAGPSTATVRATAAPGNRGPVLLMTVAPDPAWTDLPAKPLFVPLLQELIRQGTGRAKRTPLVIAGEPMTLPSGIARLLPVKPASTSATDANGSSAAAGSADAPTALTIGPSGQPTLPARRAGLYRMIDDGGQDRGVLFIRPDTRASGTDATDQARAAQWLSQSVPSGVQWIDADATALAGAPGESQQSKPSGSNGSLPWIFAVALALALAEMVLAKRADHAAVIPGPGPALSSARAASTEGNA